MLLKFLYNPKILDTILVFKRLIIYLPQFFIGKPETFDANWTGEQFIIF